MKMKARRRQYQQDLKRYGVNGLEACALTRKAEKDIGNNGDANAQTDYWGVIERQKKER